MNIFVKVKTGRKEEKVERVDENHFLVLVKERPMKGLANEAVVRVLADYFKVGVSRVNIVSGFKSRQKVIKIGLCA